MQCCGSGARYGSARIRNIMPDPATEVIDPGLDLNLDKNPQENEKFEHNDIENAFI
jgi:hypothetical protein